MAEEKGTAVVYSGENDGDQTGHETQPSPKHHKKDAKKYVAFRSDDDDSSEFEVDETAR